ncbi:hypothetical protein F3Y22_tig00110890pilonHSYRG00751 [Hibiscus syriacus]|uniref:CCHC-type domain-containing protein n=1 Tax=Hibiscus syriacus TaxID=106335 RepID=A0A6A2ZI88_HIBSY|nr:hypothetical protein F3Y22_tig00110890pilonHSYRG00751 [Hibiscus syriacus]
MSNENPSVLPILSNTLVAVRRMGISRFNLQTSLERSGSPVLVVDQRVQKKVKNNKGDGEEQTNSVLEERETEVMEVESVRGSAARNECDDSGIQQTDIPNMRIHGINIGKTTYASMVADSPTSLKTLNSGCGINNDEVIVLEDDYIIDRPVGEVHLTDLDNNYFLVKFADERDYIKVLTEGPWTIYESYLTVQPWSRNFSTVEKYSYQVIIWIRLPGLPYRYYTKALFRLIATMVGDVVKIDYNIQVGERGNFARLAVLVDLNKPLIPCIGIDGVKRKIEYEELHQICFHCGVYGHVKEQCMKWLYGPWMVLENCMKRTEQNRQKSNTRVNESVSTWSRFAALEEARNESELASEEKLEGLLDLGFVGPDFTWTKGNLHHRLDRRLANNSWCTNFEDSRVFHLDCLGLDHRPIILWNQDVDIEVNISSFRNQVAAWNSETFGHIGKRNKRSIVRIHGVDRAMQHTNLESLARLEVFYPTRGIRQGDQLSPYILVLCMERPAQPIQFEINRNRWKPFRTDKHGPDISHLLFSDDMILSAEASIEQLDVIRNVLDHFCIVSGHKITMEKTTIYFFRNVSLELKNIINRDFGFTMVDDRCNP